MVSRSYAAGLVPPSSIRRTPCGCSLGADGPVAVALDVEAAEVVEREPDGNTLRAALDRTRDELPVVVDGHALAE